MHPLGEARGEHGRAHPREDGGVVLELARAHHGEQLVGGDAVGMPAHDDELPAAAPGVRERRLAEERQVFRMRRGTVDVAVEVGLHPAPRHAD